MCRCCGNAKWKDGQERRASPATNCFFEISGGGRRGAAKRTESSLCKVPELPRQRQSSQVHPNSSVDEVIANFLLLCGEFCKSLYGGGRGVAGLAITFHICWPSPSPMRGHRFARVRAIMMTVRTSSPLRSRGK